MGVGTSVEHDVCASFPPDRLAGNEVVVFVIIIARFWVSWLGAETEPGNFRRIFVLWAHLLDVVSLALVALAPEPTWAVVPISTFGALLCLLSTTLLVLVIPVMRVLLRMLLPALSLQVGSTAVSALHLHTKGFLL